MQDILRKQAKMREKKGYALRIGLMMLNEGVINERQLAIGLASQFGTAAVDLVNVELEVGVLHEISPALFEKYVFVPMHQDEDGLRVATDDMPPPDMIEALSKAVKSPVHYVIAPSSQVQKVRGFCKQHMRRISQGQLTRTKLPEKYFTDEEGDPESTIKPGAITLASLQRPGSDALDALGGAPAPAAAPAPKPGDLSAQFAAARAAKAAAASTPAPPVVEATDAFGDAVGPAVAAVPDALDAGPPLSDPGRARAPASAPGQVRKGSVVVESKTISFKSMPGQVHPSGSTGGEGSNDAFGVEPMGGGDALDAFAGMNADMDPLDAMKLPGGGVAKRPPPPPPPQSAKDAMEALKRSAKTGATPGPGAVKPTGAPPRPASNPGAVQAVKPGSNPGAVAVRPGSNPGAVQAAPIDAFGSVDAFGEPDALSGFGGVDELIDPMGAYGGADPLDALKQSARPGTGPLDGRVTPGDALDDWGAAAGLADLSDHELHGLAATAPDALSGHYLSESYVEVTSSQMDRVPPLSRLLVAMPTSLETLLGELKTASIESVTLAPHAHGADVLATDEHGSRLTGGLSRGEYDAILDRCRELLKLAGPITVPVRAVVELALNGERFGFRLTALPSEPPTITFAAADREGWNARRQVQQETALVEGLAKRAKARRGLVVLTGAGAAPVSETMAGLISALRRDSLRIATFAASAGPRVREVPTMPVPAERAGEMLDPETLLAVAETGVDLLAFDMPLAPEQLKLVAPLGAAEACVLLTLKERDTADAVLALVRGQVPPQLLSSALELVIAVHRAERLCPSCRRPVVLTDDKLPVPLKGSKLAGTTAFESPGCPLCKKTGVRGTVQLYEVLTWDREKLPLDTFALDKKSLLKRLFELRLIRPLSLEAQKALTSGTISLLGYLRLLGLAK